MATSAEVEESGASFSERMKDVVLSGHVLVGLSLGVKLGLFKALADLDDPVTSVELAVRTDCKERYIREWLHHMVVCDVVDVDETGRNFTLPVHRRKALLLNGEYVPDMSSMFAHFLIAHGEVLSCFRKDGPNGLPFEKVIAPLKEWSGSAERDRVITEGILSHPDLRTKLEAGARFLDVGCGEGTILMALAEMFPNSTFFGIDSSSEMLEIPITPAATPTNNIEFSIQDILEMPSKWHDSFDCVSICETLHDIPYPDKALANIHDCLKSGGIFSVFEVDASSNIYKTYQDPAVKSSARIGYVASMYHCLVSSMYHPGSAGLGTLPGTECLTQLITSAKFKVAGEPIPCGEGLVQLTFEK